MINLTVRKYNVFQTKFIKDCNILNADDFRQVCLHFKNRKHASYMKTF